MRSLLLVLGFVAVPLASACSAFTGVDSTALVTDDDGGSDSDSGRATRDSGTSRDGGSKTDGGTIEPGLGPECTALQSCCDFLDTTTAAACRSTALDANESSCSANLNAYQADGMCGDVSPPPPVIDSGTGLPTPDAGLLAGGYCSDLLACCGSDTSCLSIALAGDETQCELEYLTEAESNPTCVAGVP